MRKYFPIIIVFCLMLIPSQGANASKNDVYQLRRQNIIDKMEPNDILILKTSPTGYRFGFNFQQNSNLYYLTGMEEENVILVLSKNPINYPFENSTTHSILLINPPPKRFSDKETFFNSIAEKHNFDFVAGPLEIRKILKTLTKPGVLFTNIIKQNQKDTKTIVEKRLLKFVEKYPELKLDRPSSLTSSFRRIKTDAEIKAMQKAVDITSRAHIEAFKSMRPGMFEYQIEAVIEYVFRYSGSYQLAFPTIVGSGPNSLILHYELGSRKIEANDMIVIDIGCEIDHYCADITRTIPADGKFSPAQKEIYNVVLEANQEIINALRPGFSMAQMDSIQQAIFTKYGYEKYRRHSCTHYLGLDVHDVGNRAEPFEAGCVVTVEPGLYIPSNSDLPKEYWNIGIRIEDDVLITMDGNRVLSSGLAKTVSEIEKIMELDGLGNINFN